VLRTPFYMELEDLKVLTEDFEKPARFPQPLNRRFVLATFRQDVSSEGSSPVAAATTTKSRMSRAKAKKAGGARVNS
jgi:hypothetical protein